MEYFSLFELNNLIKESLSSQLEPNYWVIAEIAELRVNARGHCYIELVEKKEEEILAKSRAVIWSYTYRNLSAWFEKMSGETLRSGLKVLVSLSVQFHEVYGLSLQIKDIDPQYTLGERARKKNEVINQLKEDGVFDMNRQLMLPAVPQRLAIISSPTAAGFGDFINQIDHNSDTYHFHHQLFTASMQGNEAAETIISSLQQIHEQIDNFDVVIIIRGGGAQVDLDCFDDYELASHVAQFPIPVLTGIGHERDETITDLVAHTRLKTPTAVAEFLLSGLRSFEDRIAQHYYRIVKNAELRFKEADQQLEKQKQNLQIVVFQSLSVSEYKLEQARQQVDSKCESSLLIASKTSNNCRRMYKGRRTKNSINCGIELLNKKKQSTIWTQEPFSSAVTR